MRKTPVCDILGIEYPILQAGVPWVSNPELVAAVSNAGGLGILHPTSGMAPEGSLEENLRDNIRAVRRLTSKPFGASFNLGLKNVESLLAVAVGEGLKVAVTMGGSPALYTGYLKENGVTVLHQVALVRHARAAEAQGVDIIVAEGVEGGGVRGRDEVPGLTLVPQVVGAVSVPVIASGGVVDGRGLVAALALGASGVQMGTRFIATHECIAHPRMKEALVKAIDSGTIVVGGYHRPTRVLRTDLALRLREQVSVGDGDDPSRWESLVRTEALRTALVEGNLEEGLAFAGAGVGMVTEILAAAEVVARTVREAEALLERLAGMRG